MKKYFYLVLLIPIFLISSCSTIDQGKNIRFHTKKVIPRKIKKVAPQAIPLPPTKEIPSNEKVAYITFDDGPDYKVTPKILDALRKYNVKATFFVTGISSVKNIEVLKNIYSEGHAIGNHSYSHKYGNIYSSSESLLNEINQTNRIIQSITKDRCVIFRPPGGSKPLMPEEYFTKVHNQGIKIFDWNCSDDDSLKHASSSRQIINSVKKSAVYKHLYILMHSRSDNYNTYLALPGIINYLKNCGYRFLPITKYTKELHF